jgi:long-subunit acyl-CoA synthetase (AMP-forming)
VLTTDIVRCILEHAGVKLLFAESLDAFLQDLQLARPTLFLSVVDDVRLPENGFLTPTMKLKRWVLEAAYGRIAGAWYAENKPVVWQIGPMGATP